MEKTTAEVPLQRVSRARPARNVWRSRRQKLTRVIGSWLRSSDLRRVSDPLATRIVSGNSSNAEWDPEQKARLVQSITKLLQQQPGTVKEVARSASAGQGLTIWTQRFCSWFWKQMRNCSSRMLLPLMPLLLFSLPGLVLRVLPRSIHLPGPLECRRFGLR